MIKGQNSISLEKSSHHTPGDTGPGVFLINRSLQFVLKAGSFLNFETVDNCLHAAHFPGDLDCLLARIQGLHGSV
jgi:hypothetical protein